MLIILGAVASRPGGRLCRDEALQGRPARLSQSRPSPPVMGVQIICGNCSGGEERPVKTYLDRFGNCAQCGGSSFMLASNRTVYAEQLDRREAGGEQEDRRRPRYFAAGLVNEAQGTRLDSVEAHTRARAAS